MALTNDDLKKAGVTKAGLKALCAKMDDDDFKEYFAGSEHLKYWLLGDLIYEQNPYMPEGADGESTVQLPPLDEDAQRRDLPKVRMRGRLKGNSVHTPFCKVVSGQVIPAQEKTIPKPPEAGGPHQAPRTYYFQVGVNSGEEPPDWDGSLRKRRNVVKEIEIEYSPPIYEEGREKPPHIIILYAGGNN